jgi:FtsZ-interacting cell division protein YlmF
MGLKDLLKKVIDVYDDDTMAADGFDDDTVYTPKANADDELADAPVRPAPARPAAAPAAPTTESAVEEPAPVAPVQVEVEAPKKPRFKKLIATRLKSAEQAIALAKEGFIVVVDATALAPNVLENMQYYLAGAVYALGAHIYPVQENIFVFSIEEFDAEAFMNKA